MRRTSSGCARTSMSPSRIVPESGVCSVAIVPMSVDLPAPFGPRRPNMPAGIVRETSCSARTPLPYVLFNFSMTRFMGGIGGEIEGDNATPVIPLVKLRPDDRLLVDRDSNPDSGQAPRSRSQAGGERGRRPVARFGIFREF